MREFFKKSFTAGLLAVIPVAGTIWILKVLIYWVEGFFQSFIPERFHPAQLLGHDIPGLGILAAIVLILLTGMLTRLYLGKKIFSLGDRLFQKIPLGRGIYMAIKQFMATIAGGGTKAFREVALVEYPQPGSFALAFVTGIAAGEVQEATPETVYNVFIPTTPNPTSGFLLMMPKTKLIPLKMSVEDAFKFIVSGGVVVKPLPQSNPNPIASSKEP